MKKNLIFLVIISLMFNISCSKKSQSEVDEETILNYIESHKLDANKAETGIYYVIEDEGTGSFPSEYARVKVLYSGKLTNDEVFDETDANEPVWFYLYQVIEGWKVGIPLFKKGGKGILLIPSRLGYGTQGTGNIPPNSVLVFEIELLDIQESL
ncbi:MAG: peptidylprolyl isomerase [Chlorobi bacterium]|nr:peptidylprolyl isomerase [Chlorobiota bacterium]